MSAAEVFTVQEAAAFLKMNVKSLYKLIDERKVPHLRLSERRIRLLRPSLQAWQLGQETVLPPSVPEAVPALPTDAGVYFIRIRSSDRIKIGSAANIAVRVGAISRLLPEPALLLGFIQSAKPRELEAKLHRRFAKDRVHCEWFQASPPLLAFIDGERAKS